MFFSQKPYTCLYASPTLEAYPLVYFFQPGGEPITNACPGPAEKVYPKENNDISNRAVSHKAVSPELGSQNCYIHEVGDMCYISLDLPGVKQSDIQVEVKDGDLHINAERKSSGAVIAEYAHQFNLNSKIVDISQAEAHLEDGVLTVEIPKKEQTKPVDVPVSTHEPPTESDTENVQRISLDLPGVKVADLKIKIYDGNIFVEAERKRGNDVAKINKRVFVDDTHLCFEKSNAFLTNGVLSIIIPTKAETKKALSPKQIPFRDCSQMKSTNDSKVEVETVEMEQ